MTIDAFLEPFRFFSASFLATLVVALGCAYLGVYIALKRIVFVGIALAEISAAGIAFGFFLASYVSAFGGDRLRWTTLLVSMLFSLSGIALLAAPWAERLRISRENVVGVGYAGGAAASILLVWKSAAELDELKNILAGSSLYVTGADLATLVAVFSAIGAVHLALRKELVFVSLDPITARTLGLPARALDVLLYVTIGIAIAPALRTHGVLSVFGYLVIPPIAGLLLARRLGPAFWHACAFGLYGSAAGLWLSAAADLPPGPATVALLGGLLVPVGVCSRFEPLRRAYVVVEALAVAATLGLAAVALKAYLGAAPAAPPPAPAPVVVVDRVPEPPAAGPNTPADLVAVLASDAPPFERAEALEALRALSGGHAFGYDPDLGPSAGANAGAVERWKVWLGARK